MSSIRLTTIENLRSILLFRRFSIVESRMLLVTAFRTLLFFEYFSSNCCKVGNVREVGTPLRISLLVHKQLFDSLSVRFFYHHQQGVLRSYDGRFRRTDRSAMIYLEKRCKSIVGGDVHKVAEIIATR
jgi:hypothetical protein